MQGYPSAGVLAWAGISALLFAGCSASSAEPGGTSTEATQVGEVGSVQSALTVRQKWSEWACVLADEPCFVGDFNGDGRDDVLAVDRLGNIGLSRRTGSSSAPPAFGVLSERLQRV
jgi:hypothetical protein